MLPALQAWPFAVGLATGSLLGRLRGRRAAAGWSGLLLAGGLSALLLVRSGPVVTYHHLRPDPASGRQVAAMALLLLQTACVAVGLVRRRQALAAFVRGHLRPWLLVPVLLALSISSAKVARPAQVWGLELAAATLLHLVALGNAALAALALSPGAAAEFERASARLLGPAPPLGGPEPGGIDRFALALAAWAVLVPALLSIFVYERHPHVPDEVVYLIHARYLAAGHLWLSAPPVPDAFDVDLMLLTGGRWICPVPLGWPLVLAAGAFVGAPWLVNPLLSGLGVLLTYLLARELAPRRTARLLILLLAASPWFLFLGMSYMTHSWALACAVIAALGVARSRRLGSLAWGWGAGAALGMCSLIRPLDGLVLALSLGLWSIGLGGSRLRLGALVGLVLGAVLVGGLTLPYNAAVTGKPGYFPIMAYNDAVYVQGANDLGFGPEKGAGMEWRGLDPWPGHDPFQALVNHQFNVFGLDADMFGWPSGSLWLLLLAFAWGLRRNVDRPMAAVIGATVVASSFYYFAGGPDFGARYWYTLFVPCVWLSISGLAGLEERTDPPRARFAVLLLTLTALATYVPWRAHDKYPGYRGMRPDVRTLAREAGFGRSLVLVRGERHPDYASAAVYNPLDWEADAPVYAWDKDDEVRLEVLQHYRDRPIWIVDGPSKTGGGYRIAEGPRSAAEMIERAKEELSR